jgi:tRNA (cytidine/uridine-2'-O-)-methyltransferase
VHVVLVEPEIPPNTGSIARLCAATATPLHLVEPLGFRIDDKHLRRAGIDYWSYVDVRRHRDWAAFLAAHPGGRLRLFSARAARPYTACRYAEDDFLVFGSESRGLPPALREAHAEHLYRIPMVSAHVRSLNVATAVAVVLFEALRQLGRA